MATKIAFCLVENNRGEILFIQRGYGREKGKWALPGGLVDRGESHAVAAARETLEEAGMKVEVISRVLPRNMTGKTSARTYFGKSVGGKLRPKRPECSDAKFIDPRHIKRHQLAFRRDWETLDVWRDMKAKLAEAKSAPLPACPYCASADVGIRDYPHHNQYVCNACQKTFNPSSPLKSERKPDAAPGDEWELIGTRVYGEEDYDMVSDWLRSEISDVEKRGLSGVDGLTRYINGRTFQYMLVFADVRGDILGVYRTPKNSRAANKDAFKSKPKLPDKPSWHLIGSYSATSSGWANTGSLDNVPKWVLDRTNGGQYNGELRGSRFRYKVRCEVRGDCRTIKVWKKPRMRYWNELKRKEHRR